jgi:integrase
VSRSVTKVRRKGSATDLTDNNVRTALARASTQSRNGQRDYAIILASCSIGLRAAEIANLRWQYVLDENGQIGSTLKLPPEAAKWRSSGELPLPKAFQTALERLYAFQRSKSGVKPTDPIFASQKGSGLTRQSVVDLFKRIWAAVGVNASSHSGRRYFITKAARSVSTVGGSLRDVMNLARHKNLSTTTRYIAQNTKAQRQLVDVVAKGFK